MLAVPTRIWPQPPWQVFLLNGVGSRASGLGSPGRLAVRKGTVLAYDLGPRHRTHLNCILLWGDPEHSAGASGPQASRRWRRAG